MNKKLLVNKITTCLMAVLMLVLMGGELRVYATEANPLHEKLVTAQSSYLKQNETNSLKPFASGSNDTYKSINQTTPKLTQTAVNAPTSSKLFKTTLATKGLNMRSGPGTSNPVIAKIPYGTKVEILKLGSSWSQINHRGKTGYVATRYLGALPLSPNDSGTDYLVTARVNFRSGPGSAYKSYGRLAAGTELIVLAKKGSWYQVSYQGRTGYIHFNYLKKKSNSSDKPADPKSNNSSYIVEKTVNFRSGPSASYQSYGLLSQGTKVEVLSTAGSWYQVNYQGRTGYIHSSYLKKESETPTKPLLPDVKTTTYIAEKRVNFRQDSKNSSNILSKIMPGVEVELIATSGTWSKIIHNGVTGFVASSYIKKRSQGRPRIGIAWFGSYKSYKKYVDALVNAGGEVVFLPQVASAKEAKAALENVDGMVSIGGGDFNSSYYGEKMTPYIEKLDNARDQSDYWILRGALDANLPLLGICRGLQWINVLYGGTLYQDIPAQLGTKVTHRDPKRLVNTYHDVTIKKGTKLAEMIGSGVQKLDSWHHQGIKKVGQNLSVSATTGDGLVEGIEATDKKFVVGVQFHPEKMYTDRHIKYLNLFKRLVNESK